MLGTVAAGLGLVVTLSVANARIRVANAQTAVEAETSRQRLVRLNVQTGNRLVEDGDPHTALAWFVEALALERGNPALEDVHRRRIGAVLRMTPALEGLWFHDAFVNEVRIRPDGHRVAAISQDSTARLWRVDDGASLWEGVKAFGVQFSPDNRHLMTWTRPEGSKL
jgi:WD40 repeat protein